MTVDERMANARTWTGLVAEIRAQDPGFLRPPLLDRLLPVARDGTVVVLNVGSRRCDAIAVTRDGVRVIPLRRLSGQLVDERVRAYLHAVDTDGDLRASLAWLWDDLAEPILDTLGHRGPPAAERLWWCPTGLLTLLPIHAAGRHDQPGAAVLDRVISSYTPSLRALLDARRPAGNPSARLLFAGVPGRPFLPTVERERKIVERLLPYGRRTVLTEEDATPDAVREALAEHGWVHFSCHADQDLDDPSRGGLRLHDGVLTVEELSAGRHRGEFAFLSGCKTAVGGVRLPDEVLTLAAALHYSGFRHVIATLWTVRDRQAGDIAEHVYPRLIRAGALDATHAATALHEAVRALRERYPDRPDAWTPFTHTGP